MDDKFSNKPRVLGAHYSPRPLVDSLVEACLEPLFDEGRFAPQDLPRVLDPACGEGVFLASAAARLASWLARARPAFSGRSVARQVLGAVHGVDLDPVAVEGARAALVAELRRWDPALEVGEAEGQVRCGNALLGPEEAPASLCPLDLAAAFPGARPGGRFDLLVGNPPFVDAEEMTRNAPTLRRALAARYHVARGNWDLFCVFVERALELTADAGAIGLILPNKLLSARYAAETRRLLGEQDVRLLRDCASLRLFDAAVYPLLLGARKRAPRGVCQVERGTGDRSGAGALPLGRVPAAELSRLAGPGWGALLSAPSPPAATSPSVASAGRDAGRDAGREAGREAVRGPCPRLRPLGALCEVWGAAAVAEAYALVPLIRDGAPPPGALRLVNTGLVDPFRSLWGLRPLRYLGRRYERPWVDREALEGRWPRRAAQARAPKILVAGLARRLECVWDGGGVLAGKSTSLILPLAGEEWDREQALALLGLLNSEAASVTFRRQFSGLALAGGYLRVGPPQLRAFEVPDPGALPAGERQALAELALCLSSLGAQDGGPGGVQWLEALEALDERAWACFGLAPPAE